MLPSLDIEKDKIESPDDFAQVFKREQEVQARALAEDYLNNLDIENIAYKAEFVAGKVLKKAPSKREKRDELFDKILIGKYTSIPIMLILFVLILWITIKGSNYPSEFLSKTFNAFSACETCNNALRGIAKELGIMNPILL